MFKAMKSFGTSRKTTGIKERVSIFEIRHENLFRVQQKESS